MENTIFVIINFQDFDTAKEYFENIGFKVSHLDDEIDPSLPFFWVGDSYYCIFLDFDKKYLRCKKFSVGELSFYFNIGYNLVCIPYGKYENKNMTIREFFHRK